jgi:hypothetical protein
MSKIFDILEVSSSGNSSNPQFIIDDGASSTLSFSLETDGGWKIEPGAGLAAQRVTIGKGATTIGTSSTAIGYQAYADASGFALGASALATGNTSIAIGNGAQAKRQTSIAIRQGTLTDTTGFNQIALGTGAQATSFDSIAIGHNTLASGNGSLVIGSTNSGKVTNNSLNSFSLGWDDTVLTFFLSKTATSYLNGSGNVAIGRTTAAQKLHVNGTTRIDGTRADSASDTLQLYSSAGTVNVVFEDGGNVGIGTSVSGSKLHLVGDIIVDDTNFEIRDTNEVRVAKNLFIGTKASLNAFASILETTTRGVSVYHDYSGVCTNQSVNISTTTGATALIAAAMNNLASQSENSHQLHLDNTAITSCYLITQNMEMIFMPTKVLLPLMNTQMVWF